MCGSVSMSGHSTGSLRESLEEAVLDVCCLVLLKHPVSVQFGHPDVEHIMALCLGERYREKTRVKGFCPDNAVLFVPFTN